MIDPLIQHFPDNSFYFGRLVGHLSQIRRIRPRFQPYGKNNHIHVLLKNLSPFYILRSQEQF